METEDYPLAFPDRFSHKLCLLYAFKLLLKKEKDRFFECDIRKNIIPIGSRFVKNIWVDGSFGSYGRNYGLS